MTLMGGWKDLGISKTAGGELKLVYGVPETKEILTVRYAPTLPGEEQWILSINSLDRKTGKEKEISHALCTRRGKGIHVNYITTVPEHRERGAASAILAYLKAEKVPITLEPRLGKIGFYRGLGFELRMGSHGLRMELPAGKPLRREKFTILAERKAGSPLPDRQAMMLAVRKFGKAAKGLRA